MSEGGGYIIRLSMVPVNYLSTKLKVLVIVCFWLHFRICLLPEGLAKEFHVIAEIPKRLDLIDYTMVLRTSTCKFLAKKHPRRIETRPRPVSTGAGTGK